jgi:hypothetical protein
MPERNISDPASNIESTDIDVRAVAWAGAAILLTLLLVGVVAHLLWGIWSGAIIAQPNSPLDFGIAAPMLQSEPQSERTRYFVEKQRVLESTQWIDRRAGVARIPIEQAMRILAARDGKQSTTSQEQQR